MKKRLLFILPGVVIFFSLLVYFINFNSQVISKDTSIWGAFSDYLNPFLSLANLIVFIWLSLQVCAYNKERDLQNDRYQKAIEKPILILRSEIDNATGLEMWEVKNIGNGPALNLRVGEAPDRVPTWVTPVTKCYSLGKGDFLKLSWLKQANIICVTYQDLFRNHYVSLGADDETFTEPINDEYKEITIRGKVFSKKQFVDFNEIQTQRLHEAYLGSHSASGETSTSTSQTTII